MKIYWLDVETTGLSPERDALLELAYAEADLGRPFDLSPVQSAVLRYPSQVDGKGAPPLTPLILAMHTKNGLLAECARSLLGVADLEEHLLSVVPEVADREEMPTLAGSSVHFDHGFLRAKMPRLAARFSHRYYDVSAVKLFCRSLGMPKLPRAEAHRAAADIVESMSHAKVCAEWLEIANGKGWGAKSVVDSQAMRDQWNAQWARAVMPSFTIKVPNDDEGEDLGSYESDYLPRVGDPFVLWHPRVCTKREPFCGVVSGVTHLTIDKDHPYGHQHAKANVVETTVWLVEEHASPTLYCDCTEEDRARHGAPDGECANCGHQRRG